MEIPPDLAEKLNRVEQLGNEINQLHTEGRQSRQDLTVLKREADLQRSLHTDTVGQLSGVQDRLEQAMAEIAADIRPYVPRMRSLPAALLQMEKQISSLGDYSQESLAVISERLQGKADKSAVLPMQKALVLLRDMLFDAVGLARTIACALTLFACLLNYLLATGYRIAESFQVRSGAEADPLSYLRLRPLEFGRCSNRWCGHFTNTTLRQPPPTSPASPTYSHRTTAQRYEQRQLVTKKKPKYFDRRLSRLNWMTIIFDKGVLTRIEEFF